MSGFMLDGQTYEAGDLRKLRVVDQIRLERWLAQNPGLSDARSYEDIVQIAGEMSALDDPATHPEFKLFVMIGVWVAKVQAGENPTIDECGLWGWEDIVFLTDRGESEGKAPAAS